jgi:hypothetical protein
MLMSRHSITAPAAAAACLASLKTSTSACYCVAYCKTLDTELCFCQVHMLPPSCRQCLTQHAAPSSMLLLYSSNTA